MTKAERFLLYFLTAAVLGLAAYSLLGGRSGKSGDTAFVDIGKLLESYNYRKDLEQAGSKDLFRIKGTVDSLRMLAKAGAGPEVQEQLSHAEAAFEQYYSYTNQEISKKIWERLNPMLELYGKEHGLQLLIGANGAGTVLYGSPACDKTQDVLQFVNERYAKGN